MPTSALISGANAVSFANTPEMVSTAVYIGALSATEYIHTLQGNSSRTGETVQLLPRNHAWEQSNLPAIFNGAEGWICVHLVLSNGERAQDGGALLSGAVGVDGAFLDLAAAAFAQALAGEHLGWIT
jgi:hypothetical protein